MGEVRRRDRRLQEKARGPGAGARHHQLGRQHDDLRRHRAGTRQGGSQPGRARRLRPEPVRRQRRQGDRHTKGLRIDEAVRRRAFHVSPGLVVALLLLAPAVAASAPSIDYLYVDASEGGGSGGHAALALGDRVFHFEYRPPGLLRLARESWAALRHRYRVLDNRTIVVTRVRVSDETYQLILDEFTRRYLVQTQHFEAQDARVDTRRLLETALARRGSGGGLPLTLEGAGFFFDEVDAELAAPVTETPPSVTSPALVRLRERVEAAYGADVLVRAMARIREELDGLTPDPVPIEDPNLSDDRPPTGTYGFGRRYRDK